MEITEVTSGKKQQHVIIETLLAFKFDDALDKSMQLVEKKPKQDYTFKVGAKILNTIVTSIKRKDHVNAAYELFIYWFKFCMKYEQSILTRNSLIYYGIMYTKNLITERCHPNGLNMLGVIQDIYTFLPDMSDEPENERYLKYIAPLSYNSSLDCLFPGKYLSIIPYDKLYHPLHTASTKRGRLSEGLSVQPATKRRRFSTNFTSSISNYVPVMESINEQTYYRRFDNKSLDDVTKMSPVVSHVQTKELINKSPATAMELFIHGLKFYLKHLSNFYTILDSVRGFEVQLVKTNQVENFYEQLFAFLKESLDVASVSDAKKRKTPSKVEQSKYGYLLKFYVSLFLQYMTICFNAQLKKGKESLAEEFLNIRSYFKKERLNDFIRVCTKHELEELAHTNKLLDIVHLILRYSQQLQIKDKDTKQQQKRTTTNCASLLAENKQLELKLNKWIEEYYELNVASESFHQVSMLNYVFDIVYAICVNCLNDPALLGKYLQESLLALVTSSVGQYAKTVNRLYMIHYQPEKVSKTLILKPIQFFNFAEKLLEQSVKLRMDVCEELINSHNTYLKWLHEFNLISTEDLGKYYNIFEVQTIRLCGQFYSEEILINYIKFQRVSMQTSIDRLKYQFSVNKAYANEPNLLKTFHNVCENLLLSYRLKEKFDEALDTIKMTYDFLAKYDLDLAELEWLVTNWCKIKRDLWKAKSTVHQKTTIADYLEIKNGLVDKFLMQEIRMYNSFKATDGSVIMNDEIYFTLEKLDSMSHQDHLIKSRVYLEIAQFTWLNYKGPNRFKQPSEEYIDKAQYYLKKHDCKNSPLPTDIEYDKENIEKDINQSLSPTKFNSLLTLSPMENLSRKGTKKSGLNRRNKLHSITSPLMSGTSQRSTLCSCITSKLVNFQLNLYRMLAEYSKQRSRNEKYVNNLVQSRMKMKETTNVTTNADQLQTVSSVNLICPEICDETEMKSDDSVLINKLESCFANLEHLVSSTALKKSFIEEDRSMKKQFYESADLLAQMYGFFGMLMKRIKIFNIKLKLLNYDIQNSSSLAIMDYESIYTSTLLHLMKAYLSSNMFDEFIQLVFDDEFRGVKVTDQPEMEQKEIKITYQNIENLNSFNKNISGKSENLIAYHLALAHYLILKHQSDDAIKLMKNKIETSPVLKGKQTAYHYEIKYYFKYLQFILAMSNVGKSDAKLKMLIPNETPLSILEESYVSVFSVARYHVLNSIEPSRAFSNSMSDKENISKQNEESIFFDAALKPAIMGSKIRTLMLHQDSSFLSFDAALKLINN